MWGHQPTIWPNSPENCVRPRRPIIRKAWHTIKSDKLWDELKILTQLVLFDADGFILLTWRTLQIIDNMLYQ